MVDLDNIPLYELQTMYYTLWKEREEEKKMTDDQKVSNAIGSMIEDSM